MSPSRLLIVEDDPATRTALSTLARSSGFEPAACGCPDKALAALDEDELMAVIIDWQLGADADGVDVARAAARCEPAPAIVMITGSDIAVLKANTRDIPVLEYLRKPFKRHQLLRLLDRIRERSTAAI